MAKKASKGRALQRELEDKGIFVRWTGRSTLAEEMPDAYKGISQVVEVVHARRRDFNKSGKIKANCCQGNRISFEEKIC